MGYQTSSCWFTLFNSQAFLSFSNKMCLYIDNTTALHVATHINNTAALTLLLHNKVWWPVCCLFKLHNSIFILGNAGMFQENLTMSTHISKDILKVAKTCSELISLYQTPDVFLQQSKVACPFPFSNVKNLGNYSYLEQFCNLCKLYAKWKEKKSVKMTVLDQYKTA